jgi:hypothetical protein
MDPSANTTYTTAVKDEKVREWRKGAYFVVVDVITSPSIASGEEGYPAS